MQPRTSMQTNDESGLIIVAFSMMIMTMLIFVGLAIDSGNLYLMGLRAQNAADAAAMSGLGLSIERRPDAEATKGARAAALSNLLANSISEDRLKPAEFQEVPFSVDNNSIVDGGPGINATFTGTEMVVNVNVAAPLYLLGALPGAGFASSYMVRATGRASVRPVNIALILDTSDSMACPTIVGDDATFACDCIENEDGCAQNPGSGAKIDSLRTAAKLFVENFNPLRDSVSLTAYGHGAELIVPFEDGEGFDASDIADAIDELDARGATNTTDGLITSYWDARQKDKLQDLFYVHFTDGAPTATRFHFDGSRTNPRGVNPRYRNRRDYRNTLLDGQRVLEGSGSWADYDWINWGIMFDGETPVPGRLYQTPPERKVTAFTRYWHKRDFSGVAPSVPPAMIIGGETTDGKAVSKVSETEPHTTFSGDIPASNSTTTRILLNPIINLPDGSRRRLGRKQSWASGSYDWSTWHPNNEHSWYYHDTAILWADFLRDQEGIIFGIGYGQAATLNGGSVGDAGVSCESVMRENCDGVEEGQECPEEEVDVCVDAYQDVDAAHWRKDIFNRRLALSVCGWSDPPFISVDIPLIQDVLKTNTRQTGEYYAADDAETLQRAFEKIARRIKMRRASNVN